MKASPFQVVERDFAFVVDSGVGAESVVRAVKNSESNPPLYYVLAWAWAKAFGTHEVGLRSLSTLFGTATVPLAYCIGAELAHRRAGLIAAALVAVSPMLIWYSQEARSYAVLAFFCAARKSRILWPNSI